MLSEGFVLWSLFVVLENVSLFKGLLNLELFLLFFDHGLAQGVVKRL